MKKPNNYQIIKLENISLENGVFLAMSNIPFRGVERVIVRGNSLQECIDRFYKCLVKYFIKYPYYLIDIPKTVLFGDEEIFINDNIDLDNLSMSISSEKRKGGNLTVDSKYDIGFHNTYIERVKQLYGITSKVYEWDNGFVSSSFDRLKAILLLNDRNVLTKLWE